MARIPLAPSITLQFRDVFAAIFTRIFLVRRYLFVFANEAMYSLFYAKSIRIHRPGSQKGA